MSSIAKKKKVQVQDEKKKSFQVWFFKKRFENNSSHEE